MEAERMRKRNRLMNMHDVGDRVGEGGWHPSDGWNEGYG
jgi:hypothetical protein